MRKLLLTGGLALVAVGLLVGLAGSPNRPPFDSIALDFRDGVPAATVERELETLRDRYGVEPQLNSQFSRGERLYTIRGDAERLTALRRSELSELTEAIAPNYRYRAFEVPNDPGYPKQWNLRSINQERAWEKTKGDGIKVAVIDTGVSRVPDLARTELLQGHDFVNNRAQASDDVGHGTHVAGTIAQSTNNHYGVAGIAPKAAIMPFKVLGRNGSGTVTDIAEAIRLAADRGADAINLSLGGMGASAVLEDAIAHATDKGAVVVAAAGNANRNAAAYPARYPQVIGVSALDPADEKAPYSNFGAGVDIAAPGGSEAGKIVQNTIDPQTEGAVFAGFQGTSTAAPHVSGAVALMKASGLEQPAAVRQALARSARAVAEDPLNHFGAGQLDAASAVLRAEQGRIGVRDFWRWLRRNGYLNPWFWIDGAPTMVLPKLAMVVGSYLLAWLLRTVFPLNWCWPLAGGLLAGSSGLFFLRGVYLWDAPQWPMRLLGSSLPELGNAVPGTTQLNPLFASVLLPFALVALLLGHPRWRWFAVGASLGTAACLGVSAVADPAVWGLGSGAIARSFLGVNAVLCVGLAGLASHQERPAT